jgi:uncharacterized RDD family membrane protein YckC
VAFYPGQFEPIAPTPLQRGLAYALDSLFGTLGLALVAINIAGGRFTAEALAGFLIAHAVYYVGPTIVFGGTPAKLISGLRVRMRDGSRISPDAAILRYLVFVLTVAYVPFGPLITLAFLITSPERLALHDRIARTVVVYKD